MKKVITTFLFAFLFYMPLGINAQCADGIVSLPITVECHDGYGDGWNGCGIAVYQSGMLRGTVTLSQGVYSEEAIDVCLNGDSVTFVWVPGSYPDEVTFTIYNTDGSQLFSGSGNDYGYNEGVVICGCLPQPNSCPRPSNLTVRSVTPTGVSLHWSDLDTAGVTYKVEIMRDGLSVKTLFCTGTSSIVVDSLDANTEYTAFLSRQCPGGNFTGRRRVDFHTNCNSAMQLPYQENWNSGDLWGSCWTTIRRNSGYPGMGWSDDPWGRDDNMVVFYPRNGDTIALVSAPVPVAGNRINVSFWCRRYMEEGWLKAGVMTNPYDYSTFIPLVEISDYNDYRWLEFEFSTAALDSTETYRVAFLSYSPVNWNYTAVISEVVITEEGTCGRPQRTNIDSVGYYTVDLSWSPVAGATDYRVYYTTDYYGQWYDSVTVTDTAVTLSGLSPQTDYYSWVRVVCGETVGVSKQFHKFTTLKSCALVEGLRIDDVTETSVRVSWQYNQNEGFPSTEVILTLYPLMGSGAQQTVTTSGTSYQFDNLSPNSYYGIQATNSCATVGGRIDTAFSRDVQFSTPGCDAILGDGFVWQNIFPFHTCAYNSYTQMIYLKEEMPDIDSLRSIGVSMENPGWANYTVDIYMGQTSMNSFPNDSFIAFGDLVLVKDSAIFHTDSPGWYDISLDTPFPYDPSRNLVVAFVSHSDNYDCYSFASHYVDGYRGLMTYSYDSPVDPSTASGGGMYNYLPNIRFTDNCYIPSCSRPMPRLLSASNSSAAFSWPHLDGVNSYFVRYSVDATPSSTSAVIQVTDTSFTLSSLQPATHYLFFVGRLCQGDTVWSNPLPFATLCNGGDLPWFFDFESDAVGNVPMCWNANAVSYHDNGVYPSVLNYGDNKVLGVGGNGLTLVSSNPIPYRGDSLDIRFKALSESWNRTNRYGLMTDPNDTSTFIPFGEFYCCGWWDYRFNTNGLDSSATYYLAFMSAGQGSHYHPLVDNVSVRPDNGCRTPWLFDFYADSTHCQISIQSEGTHSDYLFCHWQPGDTVFQYIEVPSGDGNTARVLISDLTPDTYYECRVASLCGGDTLWSGNWGFNTAPTCPKVTNLAAIDSSSSSITIAWNSTSQSNPHFKVRIESGDWYAEYDVYDTVYTFDAIMDSRQYTFGVSQYCENTGWWSEYVYHTFSTSSYPLVTQYPYVTTFDNPLDNAAWRLMAGDYNPWVFGNAVGSGDSNSLYISNDGGSNNSYTTFHSAKSYAMRRLQVDVEADYAISFDWRANGQSAYDYLRAWLVPDAVNLQAGQLPFGYSDYTFSYYTPYGWFDLGGEMNNNGSWSTSDNVVHLTPGTYRLLFLWNNNSYSGSQPPAAVDNLSVVPYTCPRVVNISVDSVGIHDVTLSWTDTSSSAQSYSIVKDGQTLLHIPVSTTQAITQSSIQAIITGLDASKDYTLDVVSHCGQDQVSYPSRVSFTTLCDYITVPYHMDFETDELDKYGEPLCWQYYRSPGYGSLSVESGNARSGSNCLRFYSGPDSYYADTMMAILPEVNIGYYPMTNSQLMFYTRMYNSDSISLLVGTMGNPDDPSTFTADTTLCLTWYGEQEHTVPLAVHSPATNAWPAIMMLKPHNYTDLYIDDLLFDSVQTCPRAFGINTYPLSATSMSVDWHYSDADGWELEANSADTTFYISLPASEVSMDFDSNMHYTVTGLQPYTEYTFRVRSLCNLSTVNYSYWSPYPASGRTLNDRADFTSFEIRSIQRGPAEIDTAAHTVVVPILHSDNFSDEYGSYSLSDGAWMMVLDDAGNFVQVNSFRTLMGYAYANIPLMVRVYAEDNSYHSDWTILLSGEACTRISNLFAIPERRALTFRWDETDTSVNNFQLVFSPTPLSTDALQSATKINISSKTWRVEGLNRETTYFLYLRAVCDNGPSAWSSISATTEALVECNEFVLGDTVNYQSSYYTPLNNFYNYTLTQTIISPQELEGTRSVEGLAFFYAYDQPVSCKTNVSLWLQPTDKLSFESSYDMVPLDTSRAVMVYSGPMNMQHYGWNYITFDIPYQRNDDRGLLLIVDDNSGVYESSSFRFATSYTDNISTLSWYSDSYNPDPQSVENYPGSKYLLNYRAVMKLYGCHRADSCPVLQNLVVDNISSNSATVSWDASNADYLDHYEIFISDTQTITQSNTQAITHSSNQAIFTGLTPYTDYYVYVRANCVTAEQDDGVGDWAEVSFRTHSECRTVDNLQVALTGKHSARATWTNQGNAVGQDANCAFILSMVPLTEDNLVSHAVTASGINDSSVSLTGLASNQTYWLYVRNSCPNGQSPWVGTSFTMFEAMPSVINLHVDGISYNALTAVWQSDTAHFADETAWLVAIENDNDNPQTLQWDTVFVPSNVFYGLQPNTPYRIWVKALDLATGATSNPATVDTVTLPMISGCPMIAEGNNTNSYIPLYGYYADNHQRIQSVYPNGMLTSIAGKTITSLAWFVSSGGSYGWDNSTWEISLGVTSGQDLAQGWVDTASLARVYTGTLSVTEANGMEVVLDSSFVYTGGNLVVQFVERVGNNNYSSCYFRGTYAAGASRFCYPSNSVDLMSAEGSLQDFLPQVQICYENDSVCLPVTALFFDNITPSSAEAMWYPADQESAWQVAWGETGAAVNLDNPVTLHTNNCAINNLAADRDYTLYVRPVCGDNNYGAWTAFEFTTDIACGIPDSIWAEVETIGSATLFAADVATGNPQLYTFRWWCEGCNDTLSVAVPTDSVTVTGLMDNWDYHFDVTVDCGSDGVSRHTSPTDFHTLCGYVGIPYEYYFEWNNNCWSFASDNNANSVNYVYYCYGGGYRFSSEQAIANGASQQTYNQYAFSPLLATDTVTPLKVTVHYATTGDNDRLWIGYTMDEQSLSPDRYTWSNTDFTSSSECDLRAAVYLLPPGAKRVAIRYFGNNSGYAYIHNIYINQPEQYALNVAWDADKGTVSDSNLYLYEGSDIALRAIPNQGYSFYNWTWQGGNEAVSTDNPYNFTLRNDTYLQANFIIDKYNITAISSNTSMGYVYGGGRLEYQTPVTVVATPYYGFHFVGWNIYASATTQPVTQQTSTFLAERDTTLIAYFDYNRYAIIGTPNDTAMGRVEGSDSVNFLSYATLTATPNYGYHFVGWSNGESDSVITIQAVENRSLTANFTYNQYAVNGVPQNVAMGSVSGSATVDYQTPVTLTASANYGYHFVGWSNGALSESIIVAALRDTMLTALFERNSYTVAASSADTVMGYVAEVTQQVLYLDTAILTATPNYGYHFTGWSNGVTTDTLRVQVTGNVSLVANFAPNQYTVSAVSAYPSRGSVSGSASVNYLTPVTLNATPFYGYKFTGWTGDVDPAMRYTRPLAVIADSNRTIVANFDTIVYNVVALVNDSVMGSVSGADSTRHFSTAHLVATSNYGYHFTGWRDGLGNILSMGTTLDVSPFCDTTLYATFAPNLYTVSGTADNADHGVVAGTATVDYLNTVTLTAQPDICYHFSHWSNGDTNSTITVVATRDTSLVAFFEANIYSGSESLVACDSLTWIDGVTYTASVQNASFTIQNTNGCDSVATLHLTVNYSNSGDTTVTACDSFTWWNTNFTNSTNVATHLFTNAAGCDSVVTLHLTVNYSNTGTDVLSACDSLTWIDGVTYTAGVQNSTFTIQNSQGCDSTVTLHLTVNHSNTGTDVLSTCDSLTWIDGLTYTAGVQNSTFTIQNSQGCDSVVTLHLTVNYSNTGDTTATACDNFTWWNTNYTNSTNDATQVFTNAAGCDSTVTLHLTVNYSNSGDTTATACDSFMWWNTDYTNSTDTAMHVFTNAAGCDSVVTLHLTVNYSSAGTDVLSACDSLTWIDGITYTSSNFNSQFSTLNSVGCDSVVTLHLTVNYSVETYDTLVIADNELPYHYADSVLTEGGDYTFMLTTVNGCDSVVYLHFEVNTTGVDNPNAQSASLRNIVIYPNPTNGRVTISSHDVVNVMVYDAVGRCVATFDNSNVIDLAELQEGIYTLRITTRQGAVLRRVVKK